MKPIFLFLAIVFLAGALFLERNERSGPLARIFHADLLRKQGRPMTASLDSGLSLSSMYAYSPAPKSSSALPHQPSLLPRHDQHEISGLTLDGISIFNDLEAPVFEKYLQLPILKSWLQARPEVAAAWMTGSGSTMVAALRKEIAAEEISELQKNIAAEFGETFWVKETRFSSCNL